MRNGAVKGLGWRSKAEPPAGPFSLDDERHTRPGASEARRLSEAPRGFRRRGRQTSPRRRRPSGTRSSGWRERQHGALRDSGAGLPTSAKRAAALSPSAGRSGSSPSRIIARRKPDGIVRIEVVDQGERLGYIPYTDRPINWQPTAITISMVRTAPFAQCCCTACARRARAESTVCSIPKSPTSACATETRPLIEALMHPASDDDSCKRRGGRTGAAGERRSGFLPRSALGRARHAIHCRASAMSSGETIPDDAPCGRSASRRYFATIR